MNIYLYIDSIATLYPFYPLPFLSMQIVVEEHLERYQKLGGGETSNLWIQKEREKCLRGGRRRNIRRKKGKKEVRTENDSLFLFFLFPPLLSAFSRRTTLEKADRRRRRGEGEWGEHFVSFWTDFVRTKEMKREWTLKVSLFSQAIHFEYAMDEREREWMKSTESEVVKYNGHDMFNLLSPIAIAHFIDSCGDREWTESQEESHSVRKVGTEHKWQEEGQEQKMCVSLSLQSFSPFETDSLLFFLCVSLLLTLSRCSWCCWMGGGERFGGEEMNWIEKSRVHIHIAGQKDMYDMSMRFVHSLA